MINKFKNITLSKNSISLSKEEKTFESFRNRFPKDYGGGGIFVMLIISMMMLCLVLGMAVDLTKNASIKNAQNAQSQQAAEIAVKRLDAKGSLTAESVKKAVNEYLVQRGYAVPSNTNLNYDASINGGSVGDDAQVANDDTAVFRSDSNEECGTREVQGVGKVQTPYIVVKLSQKRAFGSQGDVTYIFKNGNFTNGMEVNESGQLVPKPDTGTYQSNVTYKVITTETYDTSKNLLLGMFGMPCQRLNTSTSAITFGSQSDL